MSASGRYVAFAPYSAGIVLLRDTCIGVPSGCTPTTTRVTVNTGGHQLQRWVAYGLSISADGRRVAFALWRFDDFTQTSSSDVFVRDTCVGATTCDAKTFLVSVGASGLFANGVSQAPMISGDGKSVVFQSRGSDLVSGDTNGVTDIFRTLLP